MIEAANILLGALERRYKLIYKTIVKGIDFVVDNMSQASLVLAARSGRVTDIL